MPSIVLKNVRTRFSRSILFSCSLLSLASPIRGTTLTYVGERSIPTGTQVGGVTIGGLSGISYDPYTDHFHAISDVGSRLWTLQLDYTGSSFSTATALSSVALKKPNGSGMPATDTEGIAVNLDGSFYISHEGLASGTDATYSIPPWIARFDGLTGHQEAAIALPVKFLPQDTNGTLVPPGNGAQTTGVRSNLSLESLGMSPNRKELFVSNEAALKQDYSGDYNSDTNQAQNSLTRIVRFAGEPGNPLAMEEKVYQADQGTLFWFVRRFNTVPEILPIDDSGRMFVMERGLTANNTNLGSFRIRVYEVNFNQANATNVAGIDSLQGASYTKLSKTLRWESSSNMDNVEGMCFGRDVDGFRTLVLVSDNNFSTSQTTQFHVLRTDIPSVTRRTLSATTSGSGSITAEPSVAWYPDGSHITLTATPADNHSFGGWSGDVSSSNNPVDVSMDANKEVTANFQGHLGTWIGAGGATWNSTATNWSGVFGTPWDAVNGALNTAMFTSLSGSASVNWTVNTKRIIYSAPSSNFSILNGTINLTGTAPDITVASESILTIGSTLSGLAGLSKSGPGTLVLTGGSSNTGGTTVIAGILRIRNSSALGSPLAGTIVTSGGQLELAGGVTVDQATLNLDGTGSNFIGALQSQAGSNTWAGDILIKANNSRIGANGSGQTLHISGIVDDGSDTFSLGIRNANSGGTTILSGANTYGGSTDVVVGLLKVDGGDDRLPLGTILRLGNSSNSGSATFDLNGRNQQVSGLSSSGTDMQMTVTNSSEVNSTLSILNTGNFVFTGNITGNLSLHKGNAGTLTMAGVNSYTGETTVTAGTLSMGSSGLNDTSNLSIASGAVLHLTHDAVDSVAELRFNQVLQPAGIYNAANSGGYITGNGSIHALTGPSYALWSSENANGQSPELDYDNDGVLNGIEYFMNAAPGFTVNPGLDSTHTVVWPNGGNIPSSNYGSIFVIQTSSDLFEWTNILITDPKLNNATNSVAYTLGGSEKQFVRLKVLIE